jgi:hypothetical protein
MTSLHVNPPSGSRAETCGHTDWHDKRNRRFSQIIERAEQACSVGRTVLASQHARMSLCMLDRYVWFTVPALIDTKARTPELQRKHPKCIYSVLTVEKYIQSVLSDDLCLYACACILVNSCFSSVCIMVVHIMCLTTSGGLPLFTRKRGDCDLVSITAASVFSSHPQ